MENLSRRKRLLILFLLAFGTTAMYSLPYLKSSFYDPMQKALGLTHIEIGNLLSLYGLIGMFSYFFGGWFADRFSLRNLISFSLLASGGLGFWFATFPSYNTILLIHVLWGVTTILTFFAASIKVVRMQGTEKEQGRIFGFYEGLSGVSGTLISFTGLYFFGKFAEAAVGFRYVVWLYSGASVVCGILLFFLIAHRGGNTNSDNAEEEKTTFRSLMSVVTMPKAWLIGLIIFSTYVVFSSLTYLSPYLSQVYVVPITLVTALSIIRTYVIKMVASPVAGIVTDKVGSSISVMFVGFIIMAVNCALFLVIPKGNAFMWFAVVNMVILSALLFAFRGIYFASVAESKIPMKTTGAVVGFASFIGFSPDAFYYSVAGYWLDKYGETGYSYIFMLSVGCSLLGVVATFLLRQINRREAAGSSAMTLPASA
ncbi:MFS transporter [Morganella psychrotolerans]|uniref:Transporter n=1 Tax=Morganella psychrotolerans TaxID=368603 RepID=A0A1B8HLS1_9GAMM|nr:MFS transporter [Morganella psychrotolerans]OBU10366.1 transporter [Morganella psychrotolerans]